MAPNPVKQTYKAPLARISRRMALIRTALLSAAVAVILFGVLTLQMALGNDPAIGAGPAVASSTPTPAPTPHGLVDPDATGLDPDPDAGADERLVIAAEHERTFDLFGSRVRLLVGVPTSGNPDPRLACMRIEAMLRHLHRDLTRFDPASAISELNRDPGETVRVGPSVALLVRAGIRAAEGSNGLVDFTMLGSIENAGYGASRIGLAPAPLAEALASAPARRPAAPGTDGVWKDLRVDRADETVSRPPGVGIDSGGIAKGMAADLAALQLEGYSSFAVDCGGDLAIGGTAGLPRRIDLGNPLRPRSGMSIEIEDGGIATSGLSNRIWSGPDGYSHHLIDPATGKPAWTGVVQATALGCNASEAETLAKAALLSGPEEGRSLLEPRGGILILDSGEALVVGDLANFQPGAAVPS